MTNFRSSGHHYQHRSHHQDHSGGSSSSGGNGGSYQYRYGSSHNENKPPPRFLRQQMASMNSPTTDIPFNSADTRDQGFGGYEGRIMEKAYTDPRPTESQPDSQVSMKNSGNTNEKHIPNGYAKTPQSFKSQEEKDVDNNNGTSFQPKTRRFSDRRGGYNRGSRKNRIGDEGEFSKNIKTRQQESSVKSPKNKDANNFQLEINSFPPLPTACSSTITSSSSSSSSAMVAQQLVTTVTSLSSTSQPSYVQALANAAIHFHSPPVSFASYEQRYPQGGMQSTNNNTLALSSCTTSSTQHLNNNDNNDDDNDDSIVPIGNVDLDYKMPLNKLSYAQIAQRNKTIASKGQDNENTCPSSKIDVSAKHADASYSKMEKPQEKTALSNHQQIASNMRKQSKNAAQENGKNHSHQLPRNGHSYQSDERIADATRSEAKRFERDERQQLSDKMASHSSSSHHNDHGAKKLVGGLVADDM